MRVETRAMSRQGVKLAFSPCVAMLFSGLAAAAEQHKHTGPDKFRVRVAGPIKQHLPVGFTAEFAGGYTKRKSGPQYARFVNFHGRYEGDDTPFPRLKRDAYAVSFWELWTGDIVRVLDGVYRVSAVAPSQVAFTRIPEAELPESVQVTPGTYAFPIAIGGGGLHRHGVRVGPVKTDQKGGKRVTVSIDWMKRVAVPWTFEKIGIGAWEKQTIKEGDVLWIDKWGHRVRNIVPPDSDRQIVGYIEIDQMPVPEARPKPPKVDYPEPQKRPWFQSPPQPTEKETPE